MCLNEFYLFIIIHAYQALLEEQLCQVQENEVVRLRMVPSAIPDALYMLSDFSPHLCLRHASPVASLPFVGPSYEMSYPLSSPASVDVIAGTIPGQSVLVYACISISHVTI